MRRFDKYKFTQPDKPANKELHDENEKRLRELMQLREQQDHGVFQPIVITKSTPAPTVDYTFNPILDQSSSIVYYNISDYKEKQD
jgi:hypothetical protein